MAYVFGDGFDLYATSADAVVGYWDSGAVLGSLGLIAGRFAGSQAISTSSAGTQLTKSSNVNDAVHHIVCAFRNTAALAGTNANWYFGLFDGVTGQCSIVFRSDGAILLTSGGPTGTTLATYAGAVTSNAWTAFEFEVVINNTTGALRARKNGNTVNDYDSGNVLNTRVSANNYANKLTSGTQIGAAALSLDDLLWRSDASSVPWVGDIRCYTRMPASDASVQFARAPNPSIALSTTTLFSTTSRAANAGLMASFIATFSGTIASGVVQINTGGTGNMKAAIYDSTRTTILATSNAVVNPVNGANTVTFSTPLTVTKGTTYHLAFDQDTTLIYSTSSSGGFTFTTTYASFPAASPTLGAGVGPIFTVAITPTANSEFVNETLQDGTTSYVFDSTPGDADFYNIAAIASTPVSTVAVTTRGFMEKSDAGARTGTVQLKSGGTTVAAPTATLGTSFGWVWRTDVTDPNTSAAWTAAGVNAVTIGPQTVA